MSEGLLVLTVDSASGLALASVGLSAAASFPADFTVFSAFLALASFCALVFFFFRFAIRFLTRLIRCSDKLRSYPL